MIKKNLFPKKEINLYLKLYPHYKNKNRRWCVCLPVMLDIHCNLQGKSCLTNKAMFCVIPSNFWCPIFIINYGLMSSLLDCPNYFLNYHGLKSQLLQLVHPFFTLTRVLIQRKKFVFYIFCNFIYTYIYIYEAFFIQF